MQLRNLGGGVDVFEDPYITAKMIFTDCSQFLKILISLLKWYLPTAVSFITASHTLTKRVLHSVGTFFSQNRVYSLLFLQELSYVRDFNTSPPVWLVYKSIATVNIQLSRRKFNNYSDTVCHYTNLFHWWKCAPKKSIFISIQSTTLPRIILRSFNFAITSSGFYFRNWKGMWLDENPSCHSENARFTTDFSTRPVRRALRAESLVLFWNPLVNTSGRVEFLSPGLQVMGEKSHSKKQLQGFFSPFWECDPTHRIGNFLATFFTKLGKTHIIRDHARGRLEQ